MADIKWYGEDRHRELVAELERRIEACAIYLVGHAKRLLSVPGTTSAIRSFSYWYGGRKLNARKRSKVYGTNPSAPGEPPHKQYGTLRSGVTYERTGLVARVGPSLAARIGRWLELGTSKMQARPWLRRALNECHGKIQAILGKPIK